MKYFLLALMPLMMSQTALAYEGASCNTLYYTTSDLDSNVMHANIGGPKFNVNFDANKSTTNFIKDKFMSFQVSIDPDGLFGSPSMTMATTLSHTFAQAEASSYAVKGGSVRLTFPPDANRMIGTEYLVGAILYCNFN